MRRRLRSETWCWSSSTALARRQTPRRADADLSVLHETGTTPWQRRRGPVCMPRRRARVWAPEDLRPEDDLRIVHRLDRHTSGYLCRRARRTVTSTRVRERVQKTCWRRAVLHQDAFAIDACRSGSSPARMVVASASENRASVRQQPVRASGGMLLSAPPDHRPRAPAPRARGLIGHPIVADEDGGERLPLSSRQTTRSGRGRRAPAAAPDVPHAEHIRLQDVDGSDPDVDAPCPKT